MTATEKANPGSLMLCRRCRHWLQREWSNGHPNPCRLVRWNGQKHEAPEAFRGPAGGELCSDFAECPGARPGPAPAIATSSGAAS
jgi:hypothetical protein